MLPAALLDLTLAQSRLVQHAPRIRPTSLVKSFARTGHALAVQTNRVVYPGPPIQASRLPERHEGGRVSRKSPLDVNLVANSSHPASLVRKLVENLIELPVVESRALDGPIYNEDDLQQIYADLLASPFSDTDNRLAIHEPISEETARATLSKVAQRLQIYSPSARFEMNEGDGFAQKLHALQEPNETGFEDAVSPREPMVIRDGGFEEKLLHEAILSRLEHISEEIVESRTGSKRHLPVLLLSSAEWGSLVQECVSACDYNSAERTVTLMHSLDVQVPENISDCLLNAYARDGRVDDVLNFISRFSNGEPTELQRDRLVKAHLFSTSQEYNIGTALQTVHDLESRGLNPPMKSYSRVISQLFMAKSSVCRAQGWDLFAHMRYVAHPQPDEYLYTRMIRACALGPTGSHIWAQCERALDLWQELRSSLGEGVIPSTHAYNAIISVCARTHKFSGEAFRLAREMLNGQRDAFGRPLLKPTRATFCALLIAAKTRGDLSRVRWILAEMLSVNAQRESSEEVKSKGPLVDDEIMMYVLNAYTSYKPPFVRNKTRIYDETNVQPPEEDAKGDAQKGEEVTTTTGSFSSIPPQTSAEVVTEATLLFERIVSDSMAGQQGDETSSNFADVILSTRLVNSYLSVHYQHGSINDAQKLFYGSSGKDGEEPIYERLGVQRSLRSYVEALERCAYPRDHSERRAVLDFSERLWIDVQRHLREYSASNPSVGMDARWVERAWAAMIRVMASTGNLDRAMDILRSFTKAYHPSLVRSAPSGLIPSSDVARSLTTTEGSQSSGPSLPSSMLSTRVSLFADRPLVRLTSPVDDMSSKSELADTTPPLLSFSDVELLHHRLVCEGARRRKDIGYLKWVCSAYKGALKRRWESALLTRKSNSRSEETSK